ncbi:MULTISPECIES: ATP-binding protein [Hydrogenophaga]|uniref:Carbamoyl-phosphate synthase L chain, ATP-binding protein n=1 Tax=Hydrogenophaga intermedia TaxID=65786 RepID=A0A1L1PJA1_HYDIT|nr:MULTISPECIES: biotin carboxylase N-terminal domain-containing protein [Hydrogenophaga]AOS80533.1 carbamoyl-phosphate synthase large subunit [Hydrogenophaga sp. PBC]TMU78185.1 biotin/lipoyl-binding protein [Hydrogenophaga intermedia]CDN88824.1 Carbamoyl-phosphate synthase L chain, ATP-binding protein [Hydrogenophaga intermedia]
MRRLLIANRGEIARRVIRTAHRMGIATVAVHSDPDANALHVREASTAFALGGASSAESYLRIQRLIDAARATGADALHPGYGFLSENAEFAQAVMDAGLVWVGPPPEAIRALGSKSAAKALAQRHGVPVLPGYFGDDQRDETFIAEAARIGYPLMVKAVAGGGGRGMRLVTEAAQLPAALASARAEALAGFGSADLLIERAVQRPRHVEVQVFADAHGRCIHLGERDCSVQRRHQKIIEEAPSPAVGPELREQLGAAAVALAQAAGYVGAGTVEFLLDGDQFFLMEMNTRLQVEHPVTEMLTGLDLVEWQIRVARGEPLPLTQDQVRLQGHAIEVRLCAEDERLSPHTGTVRAFVEPPPGEGLRFDHAIEPGTEVTPHYDAMLGKLIAHAATREQAIERLAHALDATVLLGLPSNRAFLAACLRHPVFGAGEALIPFLAEQGEGIRAALRPPHDAVLAALLAAAYAGQPAPGALPCPFARPLRWALGDALFDLAVLEKGNGRLNVTVEGRPHTAVLDAMGVTIDGAHHTTTAVPLGEGRWHVQVGSHTLMLSDMSHAARASAGAGGAVSELRAPFNGKLVAVHARPGARVAKGDTLFAIESMKIEHQIAAPRDATVQAVSVSAGQQVAPGQLLVSFASPEVTA